MNKTTISIELVLAVVFITLKLCGVIDWSWWYVTMPIWILPAIPIAAAIVTVVLMAIVALWAYTYEALFGK